MPHKDKKVCGSLVLDFGIRWHHVKMIYMCGEERLIWWGEQSTTLTKILYFCGLIYRLISHIGTISTVIYFDTHRGTQLSNYSTLPSH